MAITNPTVEKIFQDLEAYRDYCRFEGKVFDEAALYNKRDFNWKSYEKFRSKNKTKGARFK